MSHKVDVYQLSCSLYNKITNARENRKWRESEKKDIVFLTPWPEVLISNSVEPIFSGTNCIPLTRLRSHLLL